MGTSVFIDKTIITRILLNKLNSYKSSGIIKARHVAGFELPERIASAGEEFEVTPDIIAIKGNEMHIYKIELNRPLPLSICKLLSGFAKKNNGIFYIVIPDTIRKKVEEQITLNNIDAKIITFYQPLRFTG